MRQVSRDRKEATTRALTAVSAERNRQRVKWGDQGYLPNDTGPGLELFGWSPQILAEQCRWRVYRQRGWFMTLLREVVLVRGTDDPVKLRAGLIRVAAVAVAWIEKLDREGVSSERLGRRANASV